MRHMKISKGLLSNFFIGFLRKSGTCDYKEMSNYTIYYNSMFM